MLRKLLGGVVMGFGFSIVFVLILYLVWYFFGSLSIDLNCVKNTCCKHTFEQESLQPIGKKQEMISSEESVLFRSLGIREKILSSSAVAISEYRTTHDGHMQSVITNFCKKDQDVHVRYEVGDVFPPYEAFPKGYTHRGDGFIIYFRGSPSTVELATAYSNEHVSQNITIREFEAMCTELP